MNQEKSKDIEPIEDKYTDPSINIALDTIKKNKQAIFFVNTKPSAEKLAEEISKKIKDVNLEDLSESILKALPKPTYQCKRLSTTVLKGIAFHHSGLTSKQRDIIEDNFKQGKIKIICATPTLAAGVDMPAFRSVVRDLKRYGGQWGMMDIPVLEYQQMAGRAGRPSFDPWGEAITIAKSESDKDEIYHKYITADSENIYSKLAVEPVLRTYLLSLIASGFVKTRKEIIEFFSKTFWAYQYKDMYKLEMIIDRMLELLTEWEFIRENNNDITTQTNDDFISANEISNNKESKYRPTLIGKRVAELYLDPYTAHLLITAMNNSLNKKTILFSILHMVCSTLEMRPLLRVRTKEWEFIEDALARYEDYLLFVEPEQYDLDYDDFMNGIKTAMFMQEWCDEMDEEYLLEKYNIRPGEIRAKLDIADWLIYSSSEIAKILSLNEFNKGLNIARTRLKFGAKEELIPLLRLKNIGRVRARKMYNAGLKTVGDLRKVDITTLTQLIGQKTAKSLKEELGQEIESKTGRERKGQVGINKYTK
ncbi:MAG: helicase-related protein [Candidatus Woesearchaeota archaeon]